VIVSAIYWGLLFSFFLGFGDFLVRNRQFFRLL